MKKIILKNGLIAGIIVSFIMIITMILFTNFPEFLYSELLGFVGMFIAFSFIFIGIKKYRNDQNNGTISFLEALKVGLGIAALTSCIYVGIWLLEYYLIYPDFMEKFAEVSLQKMKSKGSTAAEIAAKTAELNTYKEYYKSPIMIVLLTFMEILPLGIIVALVSALILKRNKKE